MDAKSRDDRGSPQARLIADGKTWIPKQKEFLEARQDFEKLIHNATFPLAMFFSERMMAHVPAGSRQRELRRVGLKQSDISSRPKLEFLTNARLAACCLCAASGLGNSN